MMVSLPIIIWIAVLLVLALVTPLFSPFYRKPELQEEPPLRGDGKAAAPLSIIITVHDKAKRLEEVIDMFLVQDYPAEYQVVVVIDENDTASEAVLKLRKENPRLYYTKLPMSSRYVSRKKLAITLGMRAAKHSWCIVTSVYCYPNDDQWLKNFCAYISDDKNLVIGMTPYDNEAKNYYRYEQLRTMLYHLTAAERGIAFSTNQSLVALRREEFFSSQGFSGNLESQRAEYESLVNKFACEGGTSLAMIPEAWLTFSNPSEKQWSYRHMHSLDSFHTMKRALPFRLRFHLDLAAMHLFNFLTFLTVVVGLLSLAGGIVGMSRDEGIVVTVLALVFWIASQAYRIHIYHPVLDYFGNVSPLRAVMLDWCVSLVNGCLRIRYMFADRYDFMTHRL